MSEYAEQYKAQHDPANALPLHEELAGMLFSQHFYLITIASLLLTIIGFSVPILRPLMVIYLLFIFVVDSKTMSRGGRPIREMRDWWALRMVAKRQRLRIVYDGDGKPDETKNFMFVCHPHGVIGQTHLYNLIFTRNIEPFFPSIDLRIATLDANFLMPFGREFGFAISAISVSRESLRYFLGQGRNRAVIIVPGGAEEALISEKPHHIVVKKRKGFVKESLRLGVALVPIYGFSENLIFDIVANPTIKAVQKTIKRTVGFSPLVHVGDWGIFQKRVPVNTVVGQPIYLPKIPEPTEQDVDKYHAEYMEALTKLFDRYKGRFAKEGESAHLVFAG